MTGHRRFINLGSRSARRISREVDDELRFHLEMRAVMRRTRDIGIRMALGARPRSVLRLVVSDGTRLGLGGVVLGLMGAAAGARVMRNLVFGIAPLDWVTFAAVAAILGGVTVAACYVPARRATRVDPLVAVRSE